MTFQSKISGNISGNVYGLHQTGHVERDRPDEEKAHEQACPHLLDAEVPKFDDGTPQPRQLCTSIGIEEMIIKCA